MITNQHPLSLSLPSTPPQRISALQPPQQQQQPQLPSRSASTCSASLSQKLLTPLLSRSSSLHSKPSPSRSNHHFFSSSSSNTISRSTSSTLSSISNSDSSAFPPTPPQSHHGTPLSHERLRSISNLSQADRPTPPRSSSRNDIFALSLPQPTSNLIIIIIIIISPSAIILVPLTINSSSSDSRPHSLYVSTPVHLPILGEGTHGTVHIALCNPSSPTQEEKPWKLCAAKLSEDLSGSIKETLVLERLRAREEHQPGTQPENGSRFIVGWFGLKDHKECDWIRTPEENARQRKRSLSQTFLPPIILALEYCAGGDLFKFVQRAANLRSQDNPQDKSLELGSRRWLRWAKELAEALAWCKERNVLVGDLKPQNVLLTGDLRIKLSDFNRSTILSEEQSKGGLGLIDPQGTGTSVYAAPELVQPPPSPCSFPADIFALGITMYFMLTGREPYRGIQSAVERMLLISRGGFWEHELGMRWRMLEDIQISCQALFIKVPQNPLQLHLD
ncbi:serine/threonine protein kinase [Puccinia graminis f. sp. tritici CRL 75-36-700-3]|uniref:Serine/threonine protein kinase n=1 Tax=Puccinia graminis f. sp. tritici (strain CRL 75-36-700-3 / race SCCL) TaxID=418459 RepID=E3L3Q1_PUCGT|nr:serine/threonine protein kinase [Puccinia graminis f. sp. tritici CRL 75-36-700-3]EFP91176.1 serine/threonine protein kinase [Puccinia graminis f. sp. tritici CRL 75-36-700-3]